MSGKIKILIAVSSLIWLAAGLASCLGEFVPDPVNPDLTAYSEDGKNTASALINGEEWNFIGSCGFMSGCDRLIVINEADSNRITMELSGNMVKDRASVRLQFVLQDLDITSLEELETLAGKDFNLDQQKHYASLGYGEARSDEGRLFIRRVIKKDSAKYILAGTFGFVATDDKGMTYEVFKGRFDSYIDYRGR